MTLTRVEIGRKIHARLEQARDALAQQWNASAPINHFVLDDLLPQEWTHQIRAAFPPLTQMTLRRDLREVKYVAAQMDRYDPLLEESIYAFQTPEVVQMIHDITGLEALQPDEQLYAGGVSAMARGNYLNLHIDNSHDKYRQRYRVINLLFYVSPDWTEADGCNLELWPDGPRGQAGHHCQPLQPPGRHGDASGILAFRVAERGGKEPLLRFQLLLLHRSRGWRGLLPRDHLQGAARPASA